MKNKEEKAKDNWNIKDKSGVKSHTVDVNLQTKVQTIKLKITHKDMGIWSQG